MNKRVLLVGNTNGLPGVPVDMRKYREFFKSQVGGAWYEEEIIELTNSSRERVITCLTGLKGANLDYLIIVFSGHGEHLRRTESTKLALGYQDDFILDSDMFGKCDKQLNIIDCCRGIDEDYEIIEAVKTARFSAYASESTRERYEGKIDQAVNQQITLYACSVGECSYDSRDGGMYSKNLLLAASRFDEDYMTVGEAHMKAAECTISQTTGVAYPQGPQHPDCVGLPRVMHSKALIIGIN